jgi:hypothetical protein
MNHELSDPESVPPAQQAWRKWMFIAVLLLSLVAYLWGRSFAELWIRESVYYFSTAAMAGFLYYLCRWLQGAWRAVLPPRSVCLTGGLVVIASCLFLWVHADFNYKTLPLEYEDASVARNLHEYREAFVTRSGLIQAKEFIPTESSVSSRMWLYPYLVATAHDVLGYRAHAPMVVNFILLPIFLATFFYFIWRMLGTLAAALGTLLWLSLPLLLQSATGGGASMLGLTLLTLVCVVGAAYLRKPSRETEGALILGTVLLAYTSLSALCFAVPVLFMLAHGWRRSGQAFLSVGFIATPFLTLPLVLQGVRYLADSNGGLGAWLMQTWQHLPVNFPYALNFFFSYDASQPNSLLLSVLGLVALVALPFLLRHELKRYISAGNTDLVAILLFAPFLFLQLASVLGSESGKVDVFQTSFHALNLHLIIIAALVLHLAHLRKRIPGLYTTFTMLVIFYVVGFTIPNNSKALYQHGDYQTAEQRWLEQLSDSTLIPGALIIDSIEVPWALREWTTVSPSYALEGLASIAPEMASGRHSAVYLVERLLYTGGHNYEFVSWGEEESEILKRFSTKVVAERSFRPFTLTRVHQFVSHLPAHAENE